MKNGKFRSAWVEGGHRSEFDTWKKKTSQKGARDLEPFQRRGATSSTAVLNMIDSTLGDLKQMRSRGTLQGLGERMNTKVRRKIRRGKLWKEEGKVERYGEQKKRRDL